MKKRIGHSVATRYAASRPAGRRAVGLTTALLFAAFMVSGCDKPPPETQLAAAGEALGEATTELSDLNAQIEQTADLLDELRSERRKQRDKVRTLEQKLKARATDVAIFRAVTTALLGDEQLQGVAIAVDVEDGAVTLTGVVRTTEEVGRAINLSKQIAGIASVASRIRVDDMRANDDNGA